MTDDIFVVNLMRRGHLSLFPSKLPQAIVKLDMVVWAHADNVLPAVGALMPHTKWLNMMTFCVVCSVWQGDACPANLTLTLM